MIYDLNAKNQFKQSIPRKEIEEYFEGKLSSEKNPYSKENLPKVNKSEQLKYLIFSYQKTKKHLQFSLKDWLKMMFDTPRDETFTVVLTEY